MKYVKFLLIFAICFVALCYLVPEFPETPQSRSESIDEMKLDSTGERLLLRTEQYDYDFVLPAKTLALALAPLKHSIPMKASDTPWYPRAEPSDLQLNADGSFRSRLTVTFVGYDAELRALDIGLPDKELARLERYGFKRVKNEGADDFNAKWSTDIVGHLRPHNSLGTYSGVDLLGCRDNDLRVILDTQETMDRNRRLRSLLKPVIVVSDAVKNAVLFGVACAFLLFGGSGLPSG